ncbi:hypothetical protein P6U16_06950 [Rhizobium sp. 32-5/1]|uniref:hypothetical protein n=1 Tax=Rhizobium sp. 32-5/1 TaxID=3019602 RepID=UPI00240DDE9C|nr:hypothetical protein [Rhizobium sp. 32-5/1]WEZ84367.1 hypothetical protein P6U16_06950 [Rhizobium sp. 32-5/1]
MHDMLGMILYIEMLQKDNRRQHEFEYLQRRVTLRERLVAGLRRIRTRLPT